MHMCILPPKKFCFHLCGWDLAFPINITEAIQVLVVNVASDDSTMAVSVWWITRWMQTGKIRSFLKHNSVVWCEWRVCFHVGITQSTSNFSFSRSSTYGFACLDGTPLLGAVFFFFFFLLVTACSWGEDFQIQGKVQAKCCMWTCWAYQEFPVCASAS